MDESQARNKIVGRNINNLRYADDTTLKAESEEELKSLFIRVREESERADLKLNIYIYIYKLRLWHLAPFSSVQFSCSVVSKSLQPHESQHARPPCPSPTPEFTQTHVH